ncbi:MAG: molybdopterin molybdotransferase MoeA [Lachnospiraceae bacterium]
MQKVKKKPISLVEAQSMLRQYVLPLRPRYLSLQESLQCKLAKDLLAEIDHPPFSRSPYDGYALIAQDSKLENTPVALKVVGASYAGKPYTSIITSGQAVRIMTGGCIPKGADCVIMQEETEEDQGEVMIYRPLSTYENYIPRGEDFLKGTLLVERGEIVTSTVASVAASAGYTELYCVKPIKAAVLSTGSELKKPGTTLSAGQIYDSNSTFLHARFRELGISVIEVESVEDTLEMLMQSITQGLEKADILVTTGGVSVGQRDLVPDALGQLGAEIIFHGVDIKPGMPAMFALLDGKPIIALSGNPFAAAVSFEVLVRPALAAMSGNAGFLPKVVTAKLKNGYGKKSKVCRFLRAKLENGEVILPDGQGNGQMRSMVGCNCLAEIAAGNDALPAGTEVKVHLL